MSLTTSELEPRCPRCNKNDPSLETHWCYGLASHHEDNSKDYMHGCHCCEECSLQCAEEASYPDGVVIIKEES